MNNATTTKLSTGGCEVYDWCNREHKPGANARRQEHSHKFVPQSESSTGTRGRKVGPTWISTYPSTNRHGWEPCAFFRVAAYHREADIILGLSDFRALIADMTYMADLLETEQTLVDPQKINSKVSS